MFTLSAIHIPEKVERDTFDVPVHDDLHDAIGHI